MPSINKVLLVGNLGHAPEVKTTQSGLAIATLSVATTSSEKVDGEWQKVTEWHRVTVFGKEAEWLADAESGQTVCVEGRIKSRKYTAKDGTEKVAYGIVADHAFAISRPGSSAAPAQTQPARPAQRAAKPAQTRAQAPVPADDDIPF